MPCPAQSCASDAASVTSCAASASVLRTAQTGASGVASVNVFCTCSGIEFLSVNVLCAGLTGASGAVGTVPCPAQSCVSDAASVTSCAESASVLRPAQTGASGVASVSVFCTCSGIEILSVASCVVHNVALDIMFGFVAFGEVASWFASSATLGILLDGSFGVAFGDVSCVAHVSVLGILLAVSFGVAFGDVTSGVVHGPALIISLEVSFCIASSIGTGVSFFGKSSGAISTLSVSAIVGLDAFTNDI